MRTQTLEAEAARAAGGAMQREEHDYLLGLHQYEEGKLDMHEYPIVSVQFNSPNNNYEA